MDRHQLVKALELLNMVAPKHDVKPILKNAHLTLNKDGGAWLFATNLEQGLNMFCAADAASTFDLLIPVKESLKAIKAMKDDDVSLTLDESGDRIILKGENSQIVLPTGFSVEDMPDMPEWPSAMPWFEVPAAALAEMIEKTLFAAAVENPRYAMNGVALELDESEKFRLVATDGRRLSVIERVARNNGEKDFNARSRPVVLNHLTCEVLLRLCKKARFQTSPVRIALIERKINTTDANTGAVTGFVTATDEAQIMVDDHRLHTRLVEGRYPDWKIVFPKEIKYAATFSTADLLDPLTQAKASLDDYDKKVSLLLKDDILEIKTKDGKGYAGMCPLKVPCGGTMMKPITFDVNYLIQFLKSIGKKAEFVMQITTQNSPAIFRHEPGHQYILMPLTA